MARKARSVPSVATQSVYQLKVTLRHVRPPIWRRIQVPGDVRLPRLHMMLQAAMGWYNCHLHSFTIGGVDFSQPDPDFDDLDMENETNVRLDRVAQGPGVRFRYVYDFGDGWEHDVVVEKVLPPEPGVRYPICLAGKRACPPEDCGGPWGYVDFLEAIHDPEHEQHEKMVEWINGPFNPESFDLDTINASLCDLKRFER